MGRLKLREEQALIFQKKLEKGSGWGVEERVLVETILYMYHVYKWGEERALVIFFYSIS